MSTSKKKKGSKNSEKRQERRFVAQSSSGIWITRGLGIVGAAILGAGMWAWMYAHSFEADDQLRNLHSYLICAGALVLGASGWIASSSEHPVRVGVPGLALEKGELRRMPWSAVTKIAWDPGALALAITGSDEAGGPFSFKVSVKSHAEAVAWIAKEATERSPKVVDIPDEIRESLPEASTHAGTRIDLEPLQVVGRKCSVTGKTIKYEPDARVCLRCERIYLKTSVPKKCKCGASLVHLREPGATDEGDEPEAEPATQEAEG